MLPSYPFLHFHLLLQTESNIPLFPKEQNTVHNKAHIKLCEGAYSTVGKEYSKRIITF